MVHYKKVAKREVLFWFIGAIAAGLAAVWLARYKSKPLFVTTLVDMGYRHFNSDERCAELYEEELPKKGLYYFYADWSPGSELAERAALKAAAELKSVGREKNSFFVDLSLYHQGRAAECARVMELGAGKIVLPAVLYFGGDGWSRLMSQPSQWTATDILNLGR